MNGLYEDIDEDLDEIDDEDIDEDDESLAERRRKRRRNRVRGRGYNQPKLEKSYVTQSQLQAAMSRVADDVRKLSSSVGTVDDRIAKTRKDQGQFTQMALLLPLLSRPKVVEVPSTTSGKVEKVLSGEQDKMAMLLPFMLMGGMGGGSNGGGNDMMMMMVMMIAMGDK